MARQVIQYVDRKPVEEIFTPGSPVDQTVSPAGPFDLMDVVIDLSAAATTSEMLTIKTIRTTTTAITVTEEEYDLSLTSDTNLVFRFDKPFAEDVEIKVEYPNTDALTIKVITTYELKKGLV